ncbi:MAG: 50S ribosomal protein L22 [Phycisphaerales bacterium]|nr:50S ribosomal protein L22 [Phycisphaerales bacterium]
MSFAASHRFARISPRKARLVSGLISGMPIDDAMNELEFSKKRAAWYLKAVLKSAIANAEEQEADVSSLFVSRSWVDEGPVMKRFHPKDRGRAHPIRKPSSHLHVVLEEKG